MSNAHRPALRALLTLGLTFGAFSAVSAAAEADPESWSLHGQFTNVTQRQAAFHSPYQGDNSLTPQRAQKETADITFYAGLRLWAGGAFYLNPEIDQGFGLSNTLGVAGFPSGEAYKVGENRPYGRIDRAFLRQVFALGDEQEAVEAEANALAGRVAKDRLTLTVGKYSVADLFDDNRYAHDPRADFLNWAVIESGAFDYAADAWGITDGATGEWQTGDWTLRAGLFALSDVPNSTHIDTRFAQHAWIAEAEKRYQLGSRAGTARLLAYRNQGRMARYDDALRLAAQTGGTPDLAAVRQRASKGGWALNLAQALTPEIGVFLRLSRSDGAFEAYDFTEINRSAAGGVVVNGALWGQPTHSWGTALVVNGISSAALAYFKAGGLGILIGDGRLPNDGPERIVETYYKLQLDARFALSADLQRIVNPAYNRDRGPVNIVGLRLHAEF